jgi:hypothetical protein
VDTAVLLSSHCKARLQMIVAVWFKLFTNHLQCFAIPGSSAT